MTPALLALGSNLGDRLGHLQFAVDQLAANPAVQITAASRVYETAPVGPIAQGPYLNAAVTMDTSLKPAALLAVLQAIERDAGRSDAEMRQAWGPRELDIDLLLFGDRLIDQPGLSVPHPRMARRWFVLAPANDIAGDWQHPTLGRSIAQLLDMIESGDNNDDNRPDARRQPIATLRTPDAHA